MAGLQITAMSTKGARRDLEDAMAFRGQATGAGLAGTLDPGEILVNLEQGDQGMRNCTRSGKAMRQLSIYLSPVSFVNLDARSVEVGTEFFETGAPSIFQSESIPGRT